MKKLKVYPVMLAGEDDKGPLLSLDARLYLSGKHPNPAFIRFNLYLVSDREIKEGDWAYSETIQVLTFAGEDTESGYSGYKKVEATTDPSLNLSLIPDSFIEEWVAEQGKIEHVYIRTQFEGPIGGKKEEYVLLNMTGGKNEVIILPVKDSWNKEEMRVEMLEAFNAGAYIYGDDFDAWFKENY